MLEKNLQVDIIKSIKSIYGDDVWIFKTHDQVRVGIPDILLCLCGHFVAIELKRPVFYKDKGRPLTDTGRRTNGRDAQRVDDPFSPEERQKIDDKDLTGLQKYNISLINRAGGSAFAGRYHGEIMLRLAKIYEHINKIY